MALFCLNLKFVLFNLNIMTKSFENEVSAFRKLRLHPVSRRYMRHQSYLPYHISVMMTMNSSSEPNHNFN